MTAVRILANCLASGNPLEAGKAYAVPAQVSTADADALVRMGRAVFEAIDVQQQPVKVRRAKR